MNKKVLISYFSWSGNTKLIAQEIQTQTGGDIFEISTIEPYPADYHQTTVLAKKQNEKGSRLLLKNNIEISRCDLIFVGTPAWWYTMAPAVTTFLRENNFKGKTIVPFITHGGGGAYQIPAEMGEFAQGSKVVPSFVVYGKGGIEIKKEIAAWIRKVEEDCSSKSERDL